MTVFKRNMGAHMAMFIRSLLAIFISALCVADAIAAEITLKNGHQADTIFYVGEMKPDDYPVFLNTLDKADKQKPIFIYLNSPGGDLDTAIKIGHILRQKNIETYIPENSQCYSACFFAYIGGATRTVSETGKLGVHQFYGGKGKSDNVQLTTQYIVAHLLEYTAQMGVDIETMKLAFATAPNAMYVFDQDELKDFKLENTAPFKAMPDGVLWQQNGWKLELSKIDDISCVIKKEINPTVIFMMNKSSSLIANISFVKLINPHDQNIYELGFLPVDYVFDHTKTFKRQTYITKIDDTLVYFTSTTDDLIKNIYFSKRLDAYQDNRYIAGVDLAGSEKAVQYLAYCIDSFFPK